MTTWSRRTTRVPACLVLAGAVVSVLTMAGCTKMGSLFRREPVASHPVRLAQSNDDESRQVVAAENPSAPQLEAVASPHRTARTRDVVPFTADVKPLPDPVAVPEVNVYGEFDGFERAAVTPAGAVGFQQHTFIDEGYDSDVSIDPTGKWLVFASTRHSRRADIYLQRVNGTTVTQLTSDDADDATPAFSPDGKTICFASTRAGSWDLYTMDADGRNVVQLTSGPMHDLHPSFSPDGNRIAYCSTGGRSGQWELWVADLRTHQKRMVGYGLFPSWSPDKSVDRIAFQRARHRGSRWFTLWTLDLVDGEATRVTEVAVSANAAIVSPSWSPDGKRIAFSTIIEPARMSAGRPVGQQDVWTISADGTDRQRLTDGRATNLQPCWASDGRVYFVSDRGGVETVWSVKAPADAALMADNAGEQENDAAASTDAGSITN